MFLSYLGVAQIIDNKINVYIGYGLADIHGNKILHEDDFISPSLFANYIQSNDMSFKILVKQNQFLSLGFCYNTYNAFNWKNQQYIDYNESTLKQYSFSPIIQFHNKMKESGLQNRIKLYMEVAPIIGMSDLQLTYSLFDIQSNKGDVSLPLNSNDPFYGVKVSVGTEVSINHYLGVFISCTGQKCWISSNLYNDKHFSNMQIEGGLFLRLLKDKRYFYR
jgi:hypothetical protein